jgi:5-methylcytosine-specific restriction protein B
MVRQVDQEVYNLFDEFIESFILGKNSILSDHQGILTKDRLTQCLKNYHDNFDDTNNKSFDEKVNQQFEQSDFETKLVFSHIEWLWAYSVHDISIGRKKYYVTRLTGLIDQEIKPVFTSGFGSAGQRHTNNKYYEILFNLILIDSLFTAIEKEIVKAELDSIKKWVEQVCLYLKYQQDTTEYIEEKFEKALEFGKLAQVNILLYITQPSKYERIASEGHKYQIIEAFKSLIQEDLKQDEYINTDRKIYLIRQELSKFMKNPDIDFYDENIRQIWDYALTDEGYDEIQGLRYKKAIILYGPPGTSKTYTAKHLATALIKHHYLSNRDNVVKFFKKEEDYLENRIHHLQLHPNYTYEDFIAGYQLKDGNTEKTKGTLFHICEEAAKDLSEKKTDDKPHVLILDEINRIDLSRLFGEVFSALENRDQSILIGIGDLKLTIPRNLYVIGTMNEIDFSLERIDFALRRRFLWFFYGYNEHILRSIIEYKNQELGTRLKMEQEHERFVRNATLLNNKISTIPELGEQYQIGHTFFAEVVNIYQGYKEIGGLKSPKIQLYRKDGAVNILWEISIKPMIESFLGNLDIDSKNNILKELHNIYHKN